MILAAIILIIVAFLLRHFLDPFSHRLILAIDNGDIDETNVEGFRFLWRFFYHGWKAILLLAIGLLITKMIWQ